MIKRKHIKLTKILALLMIGSCTLFSSSQKADAKEIKFKDDNLRKFVCKIAEKDNTDFTPKEINDLQYVIISYRYDIWSLEGLQNFPNIDIINLCGTSVADLSPISNCNKMRSLHINNSGVTDLSPLKGLKTLSDLSCIDLCLEDMPAIPNIENLNQLTLESCNLKDLSAIRNLKNLQYLNLNNNYIEDISAIKYLPNLKFVHLEYNNINDITPLLSLPSYNDSSSPGKVCLSRNKIDTSANSQSEKVIKKLKEKGYEVECYAQKEDTYIVNVNGIPTNHNAIASGYADLSKDVYIEFNHNLNDIDDNLYVTTHTYSGESKVTSSVQGNTLKINLNGLYNKDNNPMNAIYLNNSSGKHVATFFIGNQTEGPEAHKEYDINGDGKVTLLDLTEICKNYNKKNTKDTLSWNGKCDLRRDGFIDIYDLTKMSCELKKL